MVKVSVVIPVYNTENYLKECLDSIVNQTLDDIEIICINDGSTDNSLKILNDYQKLDNRIKIISQENSGQSVARNNGIVLAEGKYTYFMDSDDILELTALEEIYNISEDKNLDVLIFKLINFYDETYEKFPIDYYEMDFLKPWSDKVFNFKDLGQDALEIAVSPPGKLFKKELIKNIAFPEGLIFEDNVFFTEVMLKAERVSFYNKHLYKRRRHDSSTTVSNDLKFADAIIVMNKVISLIKDYGIYHDFMVGLWKKKIITSYSRYTQVDEIFKDEFFRLIKEDYANYKEEYDKYHIFDKLDSNLNDIYLTALESDNYKIFELRLKLTDSLKENKKLSDMNSKLKKENRHLKKDNKSLLNSKSWKITSPLRIIFNLFR
ncbi:glycosyltransferase [Methanobrevibacter sp.]